MRKKQYNNFRRNVPTANSDSVKRVSLEITMNMVTGKLFGPAEVSANTDMTPLVSNLLHFFV
jgi:hypothetical protein